MFGIIFTVILCAVLTVETGYSVMLQMDNIHIDNGESFVEYETAMEGLINDLKEYDSDTYRISQTRSRATRSLEKRKTIMAKIRMIILNIRTMSEQIMTSRLVMGIGR